MTAPQCLFTLYWYGLTSVRSNDEKEDASLELLFTRQGKHTHTQRQAKKVVVVLLCRLLFVAYMLMATRIVSLSLSLLQQDKCLYEVPSVVE